MSCVRWFLIFNYIYNIQNSFVRQIACAWCEMSFSPPPENFGNQLIWNNSYIRIDNSTIMYKYLFDKNVKYVSDLFDQEGMPFTFECFKAKYHVDSLPFTLYWGLISCIPIKGLEKGRLPRKRCPQ